MKIDSAVSLAEKLANFSEQFNDSKDRSIYAPTVSKLRSILGSCKTVVDSLSWLDCCGAEQNSVSNDINSVTTGQASHTVSYKTVLSSYRSALDAVACDSQEGSHVQVCATLIRDWFHTRILHNSASEKSGFRCYFKRFPNILYSIVIMYGHSIESETSSEFIQYFTQWLTQVGIDPEITDKYATPWNIYRVEIHADPKYANTTAVVLWDQLYRLGLDRLSDITALGSATLCDSGVWDKICTMNPDILDSFSDSEYCEVEKLLLERVSM